MVFIKVYTIPEVAKMLKISKNTAYELVYSGRLKAVQVSPKKKSLRVTEKALEAFLQKEEGRIG